MAEPSAWTALMAVVIGSLLLVLIGTWLRLRYWEE
jgi:hypothetical protein